MQSICRVHTLAFVLLIGTSLTAEAQVFGSGSVPRNGACFYQDANYRGQYLCVDAGSNLNNLPRETRDNISSIRVFGRAEVTVFDSGAFRGQSERFDADTQNLARLGWNDMIRSIQVRGPGFGANRPPFGGPNPDVIVRRAYDDILQREPDPAGLRLYRSRIIDEGWTEQQVREALRNSPEYREKTTMTPARAREIVRSAYLAVLQREPDPGADTYVNRVMRDRWTQQDVERELRRSPEFQNRQR